jgi:hypothetical protein
VSTNRQTQKLLIPKLDTKKAPGIKLSALIFMVELRGIPSFFANLSPFVFTQGKFARMTKEGKLTFDLVYWSTFLPHFSTRKNGTR